MILNRPYVVLFFLAFLFLSWRKRGLMLTLVFFVTGYFLAWFSEAISIRTGFPYGWYFYIYENLKGDWLNWGVPVWDSASYTFLCFAGLSVAEFIQGNEKIWRTSSLASLFVVILDIIVDPLAHLGDQWFLGKIYYYPHPGFYFNVPLSNFIGWYFVSFIIIGINLVIERRISHSCGSRNPDFLITLDSRVRGNDIIGRNDHKSGITNLIDQYGGVFLYFGIFLFNLSITLWIRQWWMAMADLFWISIPFYFIYAKLKKTS